MSEETELSLEELEMESATLYSNLGAIESLERSVVESQKVDRITMESLRRMMPEVADKNYPLATFTESPSEQNYAVSLEEFNVAKALAVAAIGGILGAILYQLINAFRGNSVDANADFLNKKRDELRNEERDLKKLIGRVKRLNLSPEDRLFVDAMDSWNMDVILGEAKRTSRSADDFISAMSPSGKAFRILDRWSSDIVKRVSEFKKRIRLLSEIVRVMYEVKGGEINDLRKKAQDITLDTTRDPFMSDMNDLELFFQGLDLDGGFKQFIEGQVMGTQEFRDLLSDVKRLTSFTDLYSNSSKSINKDMDEIEKKYAPVLKGEAKETAYKKARSAARQSVTDDDGTVRVDIEGAAGAINPMLLRDINDAERSLRAESSKLRFYLTYLSRAMYFYKEAVGERQRIDHMAMKKLMEIENRTQ